MPRPAGVVRRAVVTRGGVEVGAAGVSTRRGLGYAATPARAGLGRMTRRVLSRPERITRSPIGPAVADGRMGWPVPRVWAEQVGA